MLYRKYRPQRFSELVALDEVVSTILNQVKDGSQAHAYLFSGPKGVGKTTSARLLAKALFCENPGPSGEPCGICPSCLSVQNASSLDLIEIDAASNRGIDDIRNLKEKVILAPSIHSKKIYIIDEVHMLTKEAFNALLKTLEEPPEHVVFVLCTTEVNKVPATILSRCERLIFPSATKAAIIEKLTRICVAEDREVSPEILEMIAGKSTGGYRDAETLLMSYFASGLLPETHNDELLINFIEALLKRDKKGSIAILQELKENPDLTETLIVDGAKIVSDLIMEKYATGSDEESELLQELKGKTVGVETSVLIELAANLSRISTEIISGIGSLPLLIFTLEWCNEKLEVSNSKSQKVMDEIVTPEPLTPQVKATQSPSNTNKRISEATDSDWDKVLNRARIEDQALSALLKGCKLLSIKDSVVHLGAMYSFHQERLNSTKTFAKLNDIVHKELSPDFRVNVTLLDGADEVPPESKVNVIKKTEAVDTADAMAIFSGDLI